MPSSPAEASTGGDDKTSLPWNAIPRFVPGTTDVTEYGKNLEFLASIWPKEHLPALAPRIALLCEGTAFKKLARLSPDKLNRIGLFSRRPGPGHQSLQLLEGV